MSNEHENQNQASPEPEKTAEASVEVKDNPLVEAAPEEAESQELDEPKDTSIEAVETVSEEEIIIEAEVSKKELPSEPLRPQTVSVFDWWKSVLSKLIEINRTNLDDLQSVVQFFHTTKESLSEYKSSQNIPENLAVIDSVRKVLEALERKVSRHSEHISVREAQLNQRITNSEVLVKKLDATIARMKKEQDALVWERNELKAKTLMRGNEGAFATLDADSASHSKIVTRLQYLQTQMFNPVVRAISGFLGFSPRDSLEKQAQIAMFLSVNMFRPGAGTVQRARLEFLSAIENPLNGFDSSHSQTLDNVFAEGLAIQKDIQCTASKGELLFAEENQSYDASKHELWHRRCPDLSESIVKYPIFPGYQCSNPTQLLLKISVFTV